MATQGIQYTAPARGSRAKNLATTFATGQQQAGAFAKSLSQAQDRRTKQREKLQQVVNEAYQESDVSKRISDFVGTANESLDEQIIKQITDQGNELAQRHMKAYGPDGSPKEIAEYNMYKTQLNKHLDDLTVFVGTLEAENKAYDQAIIDGTYIIPENEAGNYKIGDTEKFKRNMFKNNNTNLTYDEKLGFVVNDGGTAVSVNLTEYGNDIKKNGPSYQAISKNAQPAMDQYMAAILADSPGLTKMSNVFEEVEEVDEKYGGPTGKKTTGVKSFTQQNKDVLTKYLDKIFADNKIKSISNKNGAIQLPPENQMWAILQENGYTQKLNLDYNKKGVGKVSVSEDVSWDNWGNPKKNEILTAAFKEYIIDQAPVRTDISTQKNKVPTR